MVIGHLPAAYLAAKLARTLSAPRALALGVLVGGVLPDVDMLWFHLVDGGQTHHHEFLTHRPVVWGVVLLGGVALRRAWAVGLGLGAVLHLLLDSIAGKVGWGWPLWEGATTLVAVPPTKSHWILSFMVHWTFMVEIAVTLGALTVLIISWRQGRIV